MKKFIIIRGPAGVGKSTISRLLAERLNARYFSFDDVMTRHKLDDVLPGADGISAENFLKANLLAMKEVKADIEAGRSVIFDGCFYRSPQYDDLSAKLGSQLIVFSLVAPVEECIARDAERTVGKIGEDAVRAVHSMVSALRVGVEIFTQGKTKEQVVSEILESSKITP